MNDKLYTTIYFLFQNHFYDRFFNYIKHSEFKEFKKLNFKIDPKHYARLHIDCNNWWGHWGSLDKTYLISELQRKNRDLTDKEAESIAEEIINLLTEDIELKDLLKRVKNKIKADKELLKKMKGEE